MRKPRDKGKVENGVQNVERWVIAPLRKRTFFSLYEVNQALKEQLEQFNQRPMQHVGRSRRQEFEEFDRPNLRPLPEKPYEYALWKKARVHIDYHVEFEKHFYSVPHRLIHQEVNLRATERLLEIFHQGKLVSVHPRSSKAGRFSTLREHMPANHQFVDKINANQLIHWAENIGPQTTALVSATLAARHFPEQAYRSCLGILSLAKKHPPDLMERACQATLEAKAFSYKALKAELDWLKNQDMAPVPIQMPEHDHIRGNDYYQ